MISSGDKVGRADGGHVQTCDVIRLQTSKQAHLIQILFISLGTVWFDIFTVFYAPITPSIQMAREMLFSVKTVQACVQNQTHMHTRVHTRIHTYTLILMQGKHSVLALFQSCPA